MYNIYCDNINTLGYEQKQNAYIVLLLEETLPRLFVSFIPSNEHMMITLVQNSTAKLFSNLIFILGVLLPDFAWNKECYLSRGGMNSVSYRIYPAIRRGFCPYRMTSNN